MELRGSNRGAAFGGTVTNSYSGDVGAGTLLGTSGMGNITMHGEGHAVCWHFHYLTCLGPNERMISSFLVVMKLCGSFMIESMCMGDYLVLQLFWGVQKASCQLLRSTILFFYVVFFYRN